jgi:hypothetical protein
MAHQAQDFSHLVNDLLQNVTQFGSVWCFLTVRFRSCTSGSNVIEAMLRPHHVLAGGTYQHKLSSKGQLSLQKGRKNQVPMTHACNP